MHRHHPDAEPRGGGDSSGDGVGNVVKFQIQKNPVALFRESAHESGAFCGKQLAADFDSANASLKSSRQFDGVDRIVDVERD